LRKDAASTDKLRNLKLFLQVYYQDRDRAYIEDDFARRLDEYTNTCKGHELAYIIDTSKYLVN